MSSETTERETLYASLDPIEVLRKIAADGECSVSMDGPCVGAVQSRRKRWDDPERIEVVGCAKHFAAEYLAAIGDGVLS